jgi:hypothetical protein
MVEILAGRAPVEPETAIQLSRVLGPDADFWIRLDASYRLRLAEANERSNVEGAREWASRFPLKELHSRKFIPQVSNPADAVPYLLQLFGAGTIAACEERFDELASVSYRHSPSFRSAEGSLLVWLRLGERQAEEAKAADFDRKLFIAALEQARSFTDRDVRTFLPWLQRSLASAGVVFVLERPLSGVALSGVARWVTPRRALIQQTLRHKSNDHFWFTFFHEAAHLLHHSRKNTFLDGNEELERHRKSEEEEANAWAASFLVPPNAMRAFVAVGHFRKADVSAFAVREGVAPGIVVGQLQKLGLIPYSALNDLKLTLDFPN